MDEALERALDEKSTVGMIWVDRKRNNVQACILVLEFGFQYNLSVSFLFIVFLELSELFSLDRYLMVRIADMGLLFPNKLKRLSCVAMPLDGCAQYIGCTRFKRYAHLFYDTLLLPSSQ